ncbi:MAG: caspase family protein [Pirellulaceae bacterium]|nr:caspase family protein [Pirellulaceae bacterium]
MSANRSFLASLPARHALAVALVAVASVAVAQTDTPPANQPVGQSKLRALLVGVSAYDHMPQMSLAGPANDVPLLLGLLREQFGLLDSQVEVLSEAAGRQNPRQRPTLANIRRAFATLIAAAQKGDHCVVYLSGHGVQEKARDAAEVDGLDEVFLPADTKPALDGGDHLENALPDNEINQLLRQLDAHGCRTWFVADCCHSGSITRDTFTPRKLLAEKVFSPAVAREVVALQDQATLGRARVTAPRLPASVVALYAARPNQATYEVPLPSHTRPGELAPYGLLTYHLVQALRAYRGTEPPTYRWLWQAIQQAHIRQGFAANPIPLLEGVDRDRSVLGETVRYQSPRFELTKVGDKWKLKAGLLHGLTEGSILAVYSRQSEGDSQTRVGHVAVTRATALESFVEPCKYAEGGREWPLVANLAAPADCELVFYDYGDARPKVAADDPIEGGPDRDSLQAVLRKVGEQREIPISIIDDPKLADWRLLARRSQVYLSPASGDLGTTKESLSRLHLLKLDALPEELSARLRKVARAEILRKLAHAPPFAQSRQAQVEVQIVKLRDPDDPTGTPVEATGDRPRLTEGELITIRTTNRSTSTKLYVTLLMIDSEYNLFPLYPQPGELVDELLPGASFDAGVFRVNAKTVGFESIVAIAVQASGAPVDFTALADSSLDVAELTYKTRGPQGAGSNLASFLVGSLFASGSETGITRRGVNRVEMQRCAIGSLNWETISALPAP